MSFNSPDLTCPQNKEDEKFILAEGLDTKCNIKLLIAEVGLRVKELEAIDVTNRLEKGAPLLSLTSDRTQRLHL